MYTPGFDGDTVELIFAPSPRVCDDPHEQSVANDEAKALAVTVHVHTQLLQGAEWDALLRKHPPIADGYDYNPDTFPPALIAASVTSHVARRRGEVIEEGGPMSVNEAAELWVVWPEWARAQLLRRLIDQNATGNTLGKALRLRNVRDAIAATATPPSAG